MPVGGDQRRTSVEADAWIVIDQRVITETSVFARIGHFHYVVLIYGMRTKRDFPRRFLDVEAKSAFEPLPFGIHKGNERHRRSAYQCGEPGEIVEFGLNRCIENGVTPECIEAPGLVGGDSCCAQEKKPGQSARAPGALNAATMGVSIVIVRPCRNREVGVIFLLATGLLGSRLVAVPRGNYGGSLSYTNHATTS